MEGIVVVVPSVLSWLLIIGAMWCTTLVGCCQCRNPIRVGIRFYRSVEKQAQERYQRPAVKQRLACHLPYHYPTQNSTARHPAPCQWSLSYTTETRIRLHQFRRYGGSREVRGCWCVRQYIASLRSRWTSGGRIVYIPTILSRLWSVRRANDKNVVTIITRWRKTYNIQVGPARKQ